MLQVDLSLYNLRHFTRMVKSKEYAPENPSLARALLKDFTTVMHYVQPLLFQVATLAHDTGGSPSSSNL
jgi:ATP-dependent Clp protease adapter protein ClpS